MDDRQTIRAIETSYKGYRFRSRLEARWAVFFDEMGIRYEYEPECFNIKVGDKTKCYLPDFHLVDLDTWVEVKGSLDNVDDNYLEMIASAIDWGGQLPGVGEGAGSTHGLLWLGPIPSETLVLRGAPTHIILQHSKGGWCNYCNFFETRIFVTESVCANYFDSTGNCAEVIREALSTMYSGTWCHLTTCSSEAVESAYRAARSARFEFGQKGAIR